MNFQISKYVLPFAAQIIGTILRVMGWTLGKTTEGKLPVTTNREIRDALTKLNDKLNTSSEKFVEHGRLRLERGTSQRVVKVFLFLGDLRRTDLAKGAPPEPIDEEPTSELAPE